MSVQAAQPTTTVAEDHGWNDVSVSGEGSTLIDELLAEQRRLTAVERFSRLHDQGGLSLGETLYRRLLPARSPGPGEQFAFEVDLDKCSGCKACVSACHSLNGLEANETWRNVGLLVGEIESESRIPKSERSPKAESRSRAAGQPDSEFGLRGSFGPRTSDFGFQQHITTACHHCVDPGCLNGCPVLAYDKDPVTGIVRHLDDQCIGCTYCVMKCPYEVPKYSRRLGIVRKCDMCANRLGAGEAPACVQGCPHEAIKITLVNANDIAESLAGSEVRSNGVSASWLPDAPDPCITRPTTRFLTRRELPEEARAADHGTPRLDPAHWPLVFMLLLTQAAAGTFVANAASRLGHAPFDLRFANTTAFGLLSAGLFASVLHLGQPLKAWRAFLGWRTSWLSREIIALNLFAGVAATSLMAAWIPTLHGYAGLLTVVTAAAGLLGVTSSAMVYVDTQRAAWSPRFAFGNFLGTTFALGAAFGAAILAWNGAAQHATHAAAISALATGTVLFVWRRFELRSAWRNAASPVHFNARVVKALLSWTLPASNGLFAAACVFGLLTIGTRPEVARWWLLLTALALAGVEVLARYVFFAAGGSKRMPGGVVA